MWCEEVGDGGRHTVQLPHRGGRVLVPVGGGVWEGAGRRGAVRAEGGVREVERGDGVDTFLHLSDLYQTFLRHATIFILKK